ncbi:hypothetical protein [Streptomyces sp. NPDC058755]|uniref:hypothetical protein n=1 Tax=Streptomyces sp. NPDC058755 TaxID=3346624 RepID=UPI00369A59EF
MPGAVVLVATVVVAVGLGAAALAMRQGSSRSAGSASGAAGATASPAVPPAADVRPVHEALHDIDARCKPEADREARVRLRADADVIVAFARRYPNAAFPVDDETGRTLSLLLVARQSLRGCDATATARVDGALPDQFRGEPTATPSG